MPARIGERRKNLRFDIRFSVFLRVLGDRWTPSETTEVSATGASFVTDRPFLLNSPVEYVLTLPPDLTKAQRTLRVRFCGSVLRCERIANGDGTFGVAVRNVSHRYLSPDEAAVFQALEQQMEPSANPAE
jgi:PilZ domain